MDQTIVRRRVALLRQNNKVSQEELSNFLGFKDRQTLSDIESGKRNLSGTEVVKLADFFKVKVDYFTDPLELAGEAKFSWRKLSGNGEDIKELQNIAGRWIATYRYISKIKGSSVNSLLTKIDLDHRSTPYEASLEGDAISRSLNLGEIPAATLDSELEDKLDTLLLYVDIAGSISGAACQLGSLNTIIVNRNESEGRRNFDIGHELFHLCTWEAMPPPPIDDPEHNSAAQKKIEKLADWFSAGLLMPEKSMANRVQKHPIPKEQALIAPWIIETAKYFKVSGLAVMWRLVNLGYISAAAARRINPDDLRMAKSASAVPPRFSKKFVEILGWGIEMGHVSVRRAANLVGLSIDELGDLFAEHGLKSPFAL